MDTPKEIFDAMKASFEADPAKVEGVNAVYQFKITKFSYTFKWPFVVKAYVCLIRPT